MKIIIILFSIILLINLVYAIDLEGLEICNGDEELIILCNSADEENYPFGQISISDIIEGGNNFVQPKNPLFLLFLLILAIFMTLFIVGKSRRQKIFLLLKRKKDVDFHTRFK